MTQRVVVVLTDDIDGTTGTESGAYGLPKMETVNFELGKEKFEIDLTAANAERLRESLALWVQHGRRLKKTPAPARRK